MIKHLEIGGFKAFSLVDVPLRPLTVLIGQNDTGKSSFLRALWILANGDELSADDSFQNRPPAQCRIVGTLDGNGTVDVRPGRIPHPAISPAVLYQLRVEGIPMQSAGYDDTHGPKLLERDGSGIPSLLDYLLRNDRATFLKLVNDVKTHVPGVEDLAITTPDPNQRRLILVLEQGFRMPADQASAGVRLLLFFLALIRHPNRPKLILLEEPENGVHPKRLADVVRLLKSLTIGELGHSPTQVVLTTHSPYLLDAVNMDEDQVLVFQREVNGERSVEPADAEKLKIFLDEFMLGEVWYNRGEEALVAK
jgi:predicted ATPase